MFFLLNQSQNPARDNDICHKKDFLFKGYSQLNDGATIDKGFIKNYMNDVSTEIKNDRKYKKNQYRKMNSKDIEFMLEELKEMKNDNALINALENDQVKFE